MNKLTKTRKQHMWKNPALLLPLAAMIMLAGCTGSNGTPDHENSKSAGGSETAATPAAGKTPAGNSGTLENGQANGKADNSKENQKSAVLEFPSTQSDSAGIMLPMTVTQSIPSLDDGTRPVHTALPPLPRMSYPLSPGMEEQLQAALVYFTDSGSGYAVLAPAGWIPSANTGANGSYGVTFEDPGDPQQTLLYYDNTWSCQGCAITDIGTYFPGKAAWAEEKGFPVYEPLEFSEQRLLGTGGADKRTVRYSIAPGKDGYLTEGSAYYEDGEWGHRVRRIELRLSSDSPQAVLSDHILGFFAANHGALDLPG